MKLSNNCEDDSWSRTAQTTDHFVARFVLENENSDID
jgi:hypothetical protein